MQTVRTVLLVSLAFAFFVFSTDGLSDLSGRSVGQTVCVRPFSFSFFVVHGYGQLLRVCFSEQQCLICKSTRQIKARCILRVDLQCARLTAICILS